ncbi:pirin family protein [Streptomyces sp. NPDC047315]|uniref:pirin family protein n=1 Tax=Streptomyces sp. NPDC047315 TaxID=3155142 RepID=UPI0033EF844E
MDVRRAAQRYPGGEPTAGIESAHAFSFGGHYDPDNLRFGSLIACNEERLAPGAGFAEHPHSHTEIVTWVVEGELTHEDSTGRATVVRPGDVQRLSAGEGVRHVERNAGGVPLVFVQMWLAPGEFGGAPSYEVVRALPAGTPYALPRADAVLHVHRLSPGERACLAPASRAYVHVVRGEVSVRTADDDEVLSPGDAARLVDAGGVSLAAVRPRPAEVLTWSFPG